jgi:hypothetical protein
VGDHVGSLCAVFFFPPKNYTSLILCYFAFVNDALPLTQQQQEAAVKKRAEIERKAAASDKKLAKEEAAKAEIAERASKYVLYMITHAKSSVHNHLFKCSMHCRALCTALNVAKLLHE